MTRLNTFWLLLLVSSYYNLECETHEDKPSYSSNPTHDASLRHPGNGKIESKFRPSESHLHNAAVPDVRVPSDDPSDGHQAPTNTARRPDVAINHDFPKSSEPPVADPHVGGSSGGAVLQEKPGSDNRIKLREDLQLTQLSGDSSVPPMSRSDGPHSPEELLHERMVPSIVSGMSKDRGSNLRIDLDNNMEGTKLQANRQAFDSSSGRSNDIRHEESSVRLSPPSPHHFDSSLSNHEDRIRPGERMSRQSVNEKNRDDYDHFHRGALFSGEPSQHNLAGRPSQRIPSEFQLDKAFVLPSKDIGQSGHHSVLSGDDFVSLTAIVSPAIKQCLFYTPVSNFVVDYQVIRGGSLDLGLFVKDPTGEPVIVRPPSPDASFSVTVPPPFKYLPYAVCLDNRKASYAEKHVALSIDLDLNWDNPSDHERALLETIQKRSLANARLEAMDAKYLESWKSLIVQLENLFGRLRRIEHLQQKSDNFASVDKALMEANIARVTNGSIIQILIMLGVATLQVILIRALFDFNSRFYRFWFGKRSVVSTRC